MSIICKKYSTHNNWQLLISCFCCFLLFFGFLLRIFHSHFLWHTTTTGSIPFSCKVEFESIMSKKKRTKCDCKQSIVMGLNSIDSICSLKVHLLWLQIYSISSSIDQSTNRPSSRTIQAFFFSNTRNQFKVLPVKTKPNHHRWRRTKKQSIQFKRHSILLSYWLLNRINYWRSFGCKLNIQKSWRNLRTLSYVPTHGTI